VWGLHKRGGICYQVKLLKDATPKEILSATNVNSFDTDSAGWVPYLRATPEKKISIDPAHIVSSFLYIYHFPLATV